VLRDLYMSIQYIIITLIIILTEVFTVCIITFVILIDFHPFICIIYFTCVNSSSTTSRLTAKEVKYHRHKKTLTYTEK